jgi:ribose 5-phosphate isomerase A
MSYDANGRNWIPAHFQEAARLIAIDVVQKFTKPQQIIGLGSGPMVAAIVKELGNLPYKDSLECIAASFQIKLEAESFGSEGLRLVDANHIPMIDVVFDGADQIDSKYNMIEGAGGALLREKVLHSAASKLVIIAESNKFHRK